MNTSWIIFLWAISVTATYVLGYTMGWTKAASRALYHIREILAEQNKG